MDFFMHNLPHFLYGTDSHDDAAHLQLLSILQTVTSVICAQKCFLETEHSLAATSVSKPSGDEDLCYEQAKNVALSIFRQAEHLLVYEFAIMDAETVSVLPARSGAMTEPCVSSAML
jgi:hypothetical protein